jgi:putative ABC transport system permease protein
MLEPLRARLWALFRKSQAERELDEEIRYHLNKDIERNIQRGMHHIEARRQALLGFGGVERIKEQSRDARGIRFFEDLLRDIRYAARRLRKNPGLTAATLITLGLGIGATTAIFGIVNSVLLQPLPYQNPNRLVLIWSNNLKRGDSRGPVSAADFLDWRTMTSSFSEIAAFHSQQHNLDLGTGAERVGGVNTSGNLFSILGVRPLIGRTLSPDDDSPNSPKVAVISYALWQRLLGASRDSIGSEIKLDGQTYTVVGVMPPEFKFPRRNEMPAGYQIPETPELWTPLAWTPDQAGNRGRHYLVVVGRLKDGVSISQAQADLSGISDRLASAYPASNTDVGARVAGMQGQIVSGMRTALLAMLAAVLMVLFIACANVASIILARTLARGREIGIRVALGAGRRRVMKQLLTESLTIYAIAGGLGIATALLLLRGLIAAAPETVPRLQDATISVPVLLFALALTLITSVVFGLTPAIQGSRTDIADALKEGGSANSSSGIRSTRLRETLIVAEIAVTVLLLFGSGLLLRSFWKLISVDPGIATHDVLAMDIGLSRSKYSQPNQQARYFNTALDKVSALPGVESVAAVYPLPFSGAEEGMGISIEGKPPLPPGQRRAVNPVWVTPDYFRTLGIRLVAGRGLSSDDTAETAPVAVINETVGRRYFEEEDPIGRHVTIGWQGEPARTIVGIIADTRPKGLDQEALPEIYVPHSQWPSAFMSLVIRVKTTGGSVAADARSEIRSLDPETPVFNVTTLDSLLARSLAQRRFIMLIVAAFAAAALIIASVGLYGVMSFTVVQRTREIGIRMALGAGKASVLRILMGRGGMLIATGTVIGLVLSAGLGRVIGSLLYGVSGTDFVTYAAICLTLASVGAAAIYIPTRKAISIDPTLTLKYE